MYHRESIANLKIIKEPVKEYHDGKLIGSNTLLQTQTLDDNSIVHGKLSKLVCPIDNETLINLLNARVFKRWLTRFCTW